MNKHLQYLNYIIRHKYFVFVAGLKVKAPLFRLIIHDWSKFLPSEWFPYTEYFYGDKKDSIGVQNNYKMAWLLHQRRNKHHWQYWCLRNDSGSTDYLRIPHKYVSEMVADWAGAGRAITGQWEVKDWYYMNMDKIKLNGQSQAEVEILLRYI